MNRYEEVFARIADEIEVVDAATFAHATLGKLSTTREMDPDADQAVLPYLWRFLYLYYYAGDVVASTVLLNGSRLVVAVPEWEDPEFVAGLLTANDASTYPNAGWEVVESRDDEVLVRKDGLTLTANPSEIVGPLSSTSERVSVLLPAHRRFAEPRWFVSISKAGPPGLDGAPITRLYFTPDEVDTARQLLAELSGFFNERGVAFQIKLLNHPEAYVRRDPFVVYLNREDWRAHGKAIGRIHRSFANRLRDDGPCFLGELGRGWRIADEPVQTGQPISFGQHRCLLVAEALVRAHDQGAANATERLDVIAERFGEAGLDLAAPYTNDAGHDRYEVLT